jgi:hypothetical protein
VIFCSLRLIDSPDDLAKSLKALALQSRHERISRWLPTSLVKEPFPWGRAVAAAPAAVVVPPRIEPVVRPR